MPDLMVAIMCTLVHIPTLILRYIPFKDKLSKKRKTALLSIYAASLLAWFILCFFLNKVFPISVRLYKLNLLLFCVLMGAVNILVIKNYIREHLFTFGLVAIIITIELSSSVFIIAKIENNNAVLMSIYESILFLIVFASTYPVTKRLVLGTVKPFLDIDSRDYWKMIWFIPISMFFAGLFSVPLEVYGNTWTNLLSRLLIGVATLFLCRSIARDFSQIKERESMGQQIRLQKQYYKALTEKMNTEREMQHNFKHHVSAIYSLNEKGDCDGIRNYCEELKLDMPKASAVPYTSNAAADGVLYHYHCMSLRHNIQFESSCTFKDIGISDIDLCSLLGNALDNAVHACKNYDGKRYISIASQKNNNTLVIIVLNSFDGIVLKNKDEILSRKRDNKRGVGIYSMKKICEKYNGTCKFSANENEFEASFILTV